MVAVPGVGAIRSLVVSLRLDDGGFAPGMAAANTATDATARSLGRTTQGLYAMRAQLAILGFAAGAVMGKMLKDAADFEAQMNMASFAAMDLGDLFKGGIEFGEFDREFREKAKKVTGLAMKLSRDLAMNPLESAGLVRQVYQFGVPEDQVEVVARAGAKLSIATNGEIAPEKAAQTIYKLQRSAMDATGNYYSPDLLASYVTIAAAESAADPEQIERFLRRYQIVATATGMTPEAAVAVTAAVTDIDPGGREYFSTASLRTYAKTFRENAGRIAAGGYLKNEDGSVANTASEVEAILDEDPAAFVMALGAEMKARSDRSGPSIQNQMSAMNLDRNTRDVLMLTTAAIGNAKYESVRGMLETQKALERLDPNQLIINQQTRYMLGSLGGHIAALTASMQRAGIVMGGMIGNVLKPLMVVLTAVFDLIASHPALAGTVAFGGIALLLAKMTAMFRSVGGTVRDFADVLMGIGARSYGPTRGVGYAFAGMGYGHYALPPGDAPGGVPGGVKVGRRGGKGGASTGPASRVLENALGGRNAAVGIPVTVTPDTPRIPLKPYKGERPRAAIKAAFPTPLVRNALTPVPVPDARSRGVQTRFPDERPALRPLPPDPAGFRRAITAKGREYEPPLPRFTPGFGVTRPLPIVPLNYGEMTSKEKMRFFHYQESPSFIGPKWKPAQAPRFKHRVVSGGQTNLLGKKVAEKTMTQLNAKQAARATLDSTLSNFVHLSIDKDGTMRSSPVMDYDRTWDKDSGLTRPTSGAAKNRALTSFPGFGIVPGVPDPYGLIRSPRVREMSEENLRLGRLAAMQTRTAFPAQRGETQVTAGQVRGRSILDKKMLGGVALGAAGIVPELRRNHFTPQELARAAAQRADDFVGPKWNIQSAGVVPNMAPWMNPEEAQSPKRVRAWNGPRSERAFQNLDRVNRRAHRLAVEPFYASSTASPFPNQPRSYTERVGQRSTKDMQRVLGTMAMHAPFVAPTTVPTIKRALARGKAPTRRAPLTARPGTMDDILRTRNQGRFAKPVSFTAYQWDSMSDEERKAAVKQRAKSRNAAIGRARSARAPARWRDDAVMSYDRLKGNKLARGTGDLFKSLRSAIKIGLGGSETLKRARVVEPDFTGPLTKRQRHMTSGERVARTALAPARATASGASKVTDWALAASFLPFGRIAKMGKKAFAGSKGTFKGGKTLLRAAGRENMQMGKSLAARREAADFAGDAVAKRYARAARAGREVPGKFVQRQSERGARFLGGALGKRAGGAFAGRAAASVAGRAGLATVGVLTGPVGLIAMGASLLAKPLNNLGNTIMGLGVSIGGPIGNIVKWVGVGVKALGLLGNTINFAFHGIGLIIGKLWKVVEKIPGVKETAEFFGKLPDQVASGIDQANAVMDEKMGKEMGESAMEGFDEAQRRIKDGSRTLGDGLVRAHGGRQGAGGTYITGESATAREGVALAGQQPSGGQMTVQNNNVQVRMMAGDFFKFKSDFQGLFLGIGRRNTLNTQGG